MTADLSEPESNSERTMANIKAVIFDMGGVLYRFKDYQKFRSMMAKAAHDETMRNRLVSWEKGQISTEAILDLASQAFGEFPAELNDLEDLNFDAFMGGKIDETWSVLGKLKEQNYTVAMLTNNGWLTDRRRNTTICSDLTPFDLVVESCREGFRKPEPEIYQRTLKRLNLRPEECVFIDDLPNNVESATKLGIHGIQMFPDQPNIALDKLNQVLPRPIL